MERKSSTRRTIRIGRYRGRHLEPEPRRSGSVLHLLVAAFLASLLLLSPAAAHHRDGHDRGRGQGPSQDGDGDGNRGKGAVQTQDDNGSAPGRRHGKDKGSGGDNGGATARKTGAGSGRAQDAAEGRAGNVSCPSGAVEFKIDRAPSPGTFSDGTLIVTITSATPTSITWASNITVESVLVKGGPVTEVHEGGTSGTASAPFNPASGSLYGISHVSFCYGADVAADVSPVPPDDAIDEAAPGAPPPGTDETVDVAPGVQEGNIRCPAGTVELKIDRAPSPGTFTDGTLVVTITAATPTSFDWTSNITIDWVLVKGGPVTEVHEGGTSGTASAPFNPASGSLYGISHVSFCYIPPGVVPEEIVDLFPEVPPDVPPDVPPEEVEAEIVPPGLPGEVPPGPPGEVPRDVPPDVPPDDVLAEEVVAPGPPDDEVLAMRVVAPEAPAAQPAEEAEPAPGLPVTGFELLPLLLVALMLLGAGILLVRRRGIRGL